MTYRVTVMVEELLGDEDGYIPVVMARNRIDQVEKQDLFDTMHKAIADIAIAMKLDRDYLC